MAQYRLTGKLEGGELAELYRAERDGALSVVVKLFHERTSVKVYAQQIAEATHKLVNVQHPGIAHVIDIGVVKRRLAIVREDSGRYTLGQVLQRLNTKEVVITSGLAMALVVDLLDAVTEAHAAGVLHGAMTPGNVLVSAEGRPSICDFGALAALNSVPALKKNFAARGRSSYRAPELSKGDPLSVQSDVYSLGAMTYELLTLREAQGDGAQMSTRREALAPPSRLDRRLNSRIDPIILRALDPIPGRRYKSAHEFSSALREFLTANGGLPGRDELKRFVDQLFPKDMQLEPSREVPFGDLFTLASVEGADVDSLEERSMVLNPRAPFSSSGTENPAIDREADTGPSDLGPMPDAPDVERERSTDWHAPEGAMPATARSGPKEAVSAKMLMRRVKHIEDFEPSLSSSRNDDSTEPQGSRLQTDEQLPRIFPGKKDAHPTEPKATATPDPAESQPISAENAIITPDGKRRRMITEERNLARADAARKRWIPIVLGSALAAMAFLLLGMWRWSSGNSVALYEPQVERPRPPPVKRPPPPPPQPKADPAPSKPVIDECYAPKKNAPLGWLSVSVIAGRGVAVVIDGDTVCGSLSKIPVAAGMRKIVVIDARTKEEYVSPTRIEANKLTRLIPIFKGR